MAFDPLLSGASTVASALFFFALETRPSGDLQVEEDGDVVAKPSTISGAGLGLFAARDLEAGTVLGNYPGRVWRADAWVRYKGLEPADYLLDSAQRGNLQQERQRRAEAYTWKLGAEIETDDDDAGGDTQAYTASFVIDPTSADGELFDTVPWIFNTFATLPTLLCRINEPGRGGDVNVVAEEAEDSVAFVLERDVKAGEELFLDYGPYYDRSTYGGEEKVREAVRSVLDSILRQRESAGGSPKSKWGYSDLVAAVEAGQITSVTFSADGARLTATDAQGACFELDDIPPDAAILDTLAKNKVDVSVLPE